jgi:aromatic ring-opening dioxygenase catalytic subunit (LigB family)
MTMTMTTPPLPTLFVSHGGGPCFWMNFPEPYGPRAWDGLATYLRGVLPGLSSPPRAILMVSAHWEAERPTIMTAAKPGMLFDYYGFPPHTYELNYPASGDPVLAARVRTLLGEAGIPSDEDPDRGFDHGVFVPMLMIDPDARLPIVQLSLREGLHAAEHLRIGRALAPLRHEGVLIIGSGNSFHNLRTFRDGDTAASALFDDWLTQAATDPDPIARNRRLEAWAEAPQARACHPREEHLIPLMVAAGAAPDGVGARVFSERIGGKQISGFAFA